MGARYCWVMGALRGFLMAAGAAVLVLAGSGEVAAARTSVHCPAMPGRVVAASSLVEVSRSRDTSGTSGGDVYRACFRTGGTYSERLLMDQTRGRDLPPTSVVLVKVKVKVAGEYVALQYADGPALYIFPAWGRSEVVDPIGPHCRVGVPHCPGSPFGIRGFEMDRLGRLAWIESYASGGKRWVRLKTRTVGGSPRTVAHRPGLNAITGVRITRGAVRWLAGGRVHNASFERPRCQIDTSTDEIVAENRSVLVVADRGGAFRGCLRSDGRWRELLFTYDSSHGIEWTNVLLAGGWVALNWSEWGPDNTGFVLVDLRSGPSDGAPHSRNDYIHALAPDGRYVYESSVYASQAGTDSGITTTRLFAARPGKPDVQLDEQHEGGYRPFTFRPFTDVKITGGQASWKNAGVEKSARLP